MSTSLPVLLTVRGTLVPTTLEAARVLHNETAGSAPGIAAARALGDLSHKVFSPNPRAPSSLAKPGELLFLDVWCDPQSIGQFFGNPVTQEQAGRMFQSKDASIWMPATGAYRYSLPAPRAAETRCVGMIRGPVASAEKAIEIFANVDAQQARQARLRGLMAHDIYIKIPMRGDASPPELLGVDLWSDEKGMLEHYADATHVGEVAKAFSGRPTPSAWEQAPGQWSEW